MPSLRAYKQFDAPDQPTESPRTLTSEQDDWPPEPGVSLSKDKQGVARLPTAKKFLQMSEPAESLSSQGAQTRGSGGSSRLSHMEMDTNQLQSPCADVEGSDSRRMRDRWRARGQSCKMDCKDIAIAAGAGLALAALLIAAINMLPNNKRLF